MFRTIFPLVGLAGLIVIAICLLIFILFVDVSMYSRCTDKGGVYVHRLSKCMKKELFISLE